MSRTPASSTGDVVVELTDVADHAARRAATPRDLDVLASVCDRAVLERELAAGRLVVWTDAQDQPIGAYAVERTRVNLVVHGMALVESRRGEGLAVRALRETIDEAIRASCGVAFEVPTDAAAALAILRRLGFVVVPGAPPGRLRLVWRVA